MSLGSTGIRLAVVRAINSALGFFLSLALAAVFGVSSKVDAFFVALSIAVLFARDLSIVVRTAVVPCLVEVNEGRLAPTFVPAFRIAAVVIATAVAVFVWLAALPITRLISPGFDHPTARDAQHLLRVLSPSLFFFILCGATEAFLHSRRHFLVTELGETLWRGMAIVALLTLGRRWGVEAYAAALAVAVFAQWCLLLVASRKLGLVVLPDQWKALPSWSLRPFWVGAMVVFCSVVQMQIEGVLDRAVISFMSPGSIAVYYYAERLAHMAPLLLSTSLLIPWLPEITRIHANVGDPHHLAKQGGLFLSGLGVLLATLIIWGAKDAVEFLLLHGKFDASSAQIVILATKAFALGIPAIFCAQCLGGLYIVERNPKAMIRLGVVAILTHATGNLLLRRWGVPGIALSCSITVWVSAAYFWLRIHARERVWFPWGRFAVATTLVVAVLFAIPWATFLPWAPLRIAVGGVAGWAAYNAVMWPAIRRMWAYEREATNGPTASENREQNGRLTEE